MCLRCRDLFWRWTSRVRCNQAWCSRWPHAGKGSPKAFSLPSSKTRVDERGLNHSSYTSSSVIHFMSTLISIPLVGMGSPTKRQRLFALLSNWLALSYWVCWLTSPSSWCEGFIPHIKGVTNMGKFWPSIREKRTNGFVSMEFHHPYITNWCGIFKSYRLII